MSMFIFKEARNFQKKSDNSDLYVVGLLEVREKDGKQFIFDRDNYIISIQTVLKRKLVTVLQLVGGCVRLF